MLLSVCVPTFNRAATLTALLEKLFLAMERLDPSERALIEVVISDNASADETRNVVRAWEQKFPNFVFHTWRENAGFDRNFMKLFELAAGDYVWTLGSDDAPSPEALIWILDCLRTRRPAGLSFGYTECDKDLRALGPVSYWPASGTRIFLDKHDMLNGFALYLGFLSGTVVDRKLWLQEASTLNWEDYCSGYVHFLVRLRLAIRNLARTWVYDPRPYLLYRNSSLGDQIASFGSTHKRLVNEFREANKIFAYILTPGEAKQLSNADVMRHRLRNLYGWRQTKPLKEERREMLALVSLHPACSIFLRLAMISICVAPLELLRGFKYLWRQRKRLTSQ